VEKVFDLLREGEENGPQHIYYLRCPYKDGGCKTFCVNDLFDSGKQKEEIVWGLMES
jgi:hypothetical protein